MGKVEIGRTPDKHEPIIIEFDDEWSFKDFTGLKIKENLDGKVIHGSCFSQEIPDTHIFPEDMKGVKFSWCNLDNVFIPEGNEVIGREPKRWQVQNDHQTWIVDKDNKPIEPLDLKIINKLKLTDRITDPTKLPLKFEMETNIPKADWNDTYAKGKIPINSWFKVVPEVLGETTKQILVDGKGIETVDCYKVKGEAHKYSFERGTS